MLHSQAIETHCASEGKNRGGFKFSSHSVLTREWELGAQASGCSWCLLLGSSAATCSFLVTSASRTVAQPHTLLSSSISLPKFMTESRAGFSLSSSSTKLWMWFWKWEHEWIWMKMDLFWPLRHSLSIAFSDHSHGTEAVGQHLKKVGNLSEDSKIRNAQKCD